MMCESCGVEYAGTGDACPNCGQTRQVVPPSVGPPGTVGPAIANGSDEVRNSKVAGHKPTTPELENPGNPPGKIIEGTGG